MFRERITYIILLTGLLAVGVHLVRDEMDTEEIKKNRYWMAKTRDQERYPVLFGGDSRVFRGLSPASFMEVFPELEAYNYGYWSNGWGRLYLDAMEDKLDTAAELKILALGISPHSLTPAAAKCSHLRYEMKRSKGKKFQSLFGSRAEEVFAPFEVTDLADRLTGRRKPANYRITYHPDGWVESYWIKPDTGYSARFYEEIFTGNRVSEEVIAGLLEYVKRWSDRGIVVAGFRPPTSQTIRHLEEERGGFDEAGFVERFEEAGGIWIDLPNDAYRTYDGNHMEHQSARRFSRDLARQIRERTGGSSGN